MFTVGISLIFLMALIIKWKFESHNTNFGIRNEAIFPNQIKLNQIIVKTKENLTYAYYICADVCNVFCMVVSCLT